MRKLKKGDEVVIISGSNKGTKGKLLKVDYDRNRVYVEGVTVKKNKKQSEYSEGGIVDIPKPIHLSNVMIVGQDGQGTRVGIKDEKGSRVRFEKKSQKVIG